MALNIVPVALQTLNASRPLIAANFANIDIGFAIEHVAFNIGGQGKHKTATFPVAAAPGAVALTEVGLYAATSGGSSELFINKTATQIPFTAALKAADGWTWLPSGMLIQWGGGTAGDGDVLIKNFTIPFPNACVSVQMTKTPHNAAQNFLSYKPVGVNGKDGFKAFSTKSGVAYENAGFTYIAIGY